MVIQSDILPAAGEERTGRGNILYPDVYPGNSTHQCLIKDRITDIVGIPNDAVTVVVSKCTKGNYRTGRNATRAFRPGRIEGPACGKIPLVYDRISVRVKCPFRDQQGATAWNTSRRGYNRITGLSRVG